MLRKTESTKNYYIKTYDNGLVKQKRFRINPTLATYFKEKIAIARENENLRDSGGKPSMEFDKRVNTNTRMKTHILDKIIFPSMANLMCFFFAIAKNYQLRLLFDDDIKELLGIKRNEPNSTSYAFMFEYLIHTMLIWGLNESQIPDYHIENDKVKDNDKKNFRIRLIHILQSIADTNIQFLNHHYLPYSMYSSDLIRQDIRRALAWTGMLAGNADDEYKLEVDPKKYEKLSSQSEARLTSDEKKYLASVKERYDEYIESLTTNRPGRTFDIDDFLGEIS